MYSTQSPFAVENVQSNCGTPAACQNRGKRCPSYQTRHDFYYIYNIFRSCLRSSSRFRLANIFNYTLLTADKSFIARHLFNKRERERLDNDVLDGNATVARQKASSSWRRRRRRKSCFTGESESLIKRMFVA